MAQLATPDQWRWFKRHDNFHRHFTHVVRRISGAWVQLECPECHGNCSMRPTGPQFFGGVLGFRDHAKNSHGVDWNHLTPDEIAERCTKKIMSNAELEFLDTDGGKSLMLYNLHSQQRKPAASPKVSTAEHSDAHLLPRRLAKADEPFRFLVLPAELRKNIFEWHFKLQQEGRDRTPLYRRQPAITRVSRDMRKESLPIYYATTRFQLTFNAQKRSLQECFDILKDWVISVASDRQKDLRSVALRLAIASRPGTPCDSSEVYRDITFEYDSTSGLSMKIPSALDEP